MNAIEQALSGLQLGEPLSHEGLTVHPLIRASLLGKDYLTLDEALKQNVARVTEVSESGSVPQLLFRNQGEQAVFLLDGEEFDLVITDLTMPNLTGDKLAEELIKIRSDIPVILCTGFSEKMSEEKAAVLGIKGYLMKPIMMKELSSVVRKVLDDE